MRKNFIHLMDFNFNIIFFITFHPIPSSNQSTIIHKKKTEKTAPCSTTTSATECNKTCFSFFSTPKHGNGTGLVTCATQPQIHKILISPKINNDNKKVKTEESMRAL